MPRKPRLEINGFYHVVNRGVERRKSYLTIQTITKLSKR